MDILGFIHTSWVKSRLEASISSRSRYREGITEALSAFLGNTPSFPAAPLPLGGVGSGREAFVMW